ncbi:GntR family transcriptional regulator [Zafaria cholistanensis]|uniref:GntR family transcriptional regulator n=1 Tax=Zafaria cholistanensis TaxID=1682741 RepID=A0A5A7NV27_9MICC|nr:GntR family transcriptional regulator [Zafaria cholistanensis]GER23878.1 GntR family transcriptional regulator [Zafaria cholistanensis]
MASISALGGHVDASALRHLTLKDSAEEIVRRALLSGSMKPGEIYSANSLSAQLGVSNSPTREAMMALAGKGLLEVVRNRGFRVVEMSDRDKQEVYDLRLLIEVEAVRRVAAAGVDQSEALVLKNLTEKTIETAGTEDMLEYLEADQAFHCHLVGLLGNRRWLAIVENLRDQSRITGSYHLKERGMLMSSAEEHRGIIEAVLAGDDRRAAELMTRHLDYARPDSGTA